MESHQIPQVESLILDSELTKASRLFSYPQRAHSYYLYINVFRKCTGRINGVFMICKCCLRIHADNMKEHLIGYNLTTKILKVMILLRIKSQESEEPIQRTYNSVIILAELMLIIK